MRLPKRSVPFQLQNPLPIDESSKRIGLLNRRKDGYGGSHDLLARVQENKVTLEQTIGNGITAQIRAELVKKDGGTLVTGTALIHEVTWFAPLGVAVFFLPAYPILIMVAWVDTGLNMSAVLGFLLLTTLITGTVIVAIYLAAQRHRDQLLKKLAGSLQAEI